MRERDSDRLEKEIERGWDSNNIEKVRVKGILTDQREKERERKKERFLLVREIERQFT
jgi:hypothetical protein